jgi:hypothetical protein
MLSAKEEVERIWEALRYWPKPPFRLDEYQAVRGPTQIVMDANDRHICTVFEPEAAALIVAWLNQ